MKEITTEEAVKKLNGRGVFINVLDRAWLQSDLDYKLILHGILHAWNELRLEEEEAEKMKKILQEKRETWWKRSY